MEKMIRNVLFAFFLFLILNVSQILSYPSSFRWGYWLETGIESGVGLSPCSKNNCYNTTSVSVGYDHILALTPEGKVLAWGNGEYGALGNGQEDQTRWLPVEVELEETVIAISAGEHFSIAVDERNRIWAWGINTCGQLGLDSTSDRKLTPELVSTLDPFDLLTDISTSSHTLLAVDGTKIYAWGSNQYGQLGSEFDDPCDPSPKLVSDIDNVVAVSAGGTHSLANVEGNVLVSWGSNEQGQLGVSCADCSGKHQVVSNTILLQIAAGEQHSLYLDEEHGLYAFGDNSFGQTGLEAGAEIIPSPELVDTEARAVAIAAGSYHSLALTEESLLAWGKNDRGQVTVEPNDDKATPVEVPLEIPLDSLVSLSAGGEISLIIFNVSLNEDSNTMISFSGLTNYSSNAYYIESNKFRVNLDQIFDYLPTNEFDFSFSLTTSSCPGTSIHPDVSEVFSQPPYFEFYLSPSDSYNDDYFFCVKYRPQEYFELSQQFWFAYIRNVTIPSLLPGDYLPINSAVNILAELNPSLDITSVDLYYIPNGENDRVSNSSSLIVPSIKQERKGEYSYQFQVCTLNANVCEYSTVFEIDDTKAITNVSVEIEPSSDRLVVSWNTQGIVPTFTISIITETQERNQLSIQENPHYIPFTDLFCGENTTIQVASSQYGLSDEYWLGKIDPQLRQMSYALIPENNDQIVFQWTSLGLSLGNIDLVIEYGSNVIYQRTVANSGIATIDHFFDYLEPNQQYKAQVKYANWTCVTPATIDPMVVDMMIPEFNVEFSVGNFSAIAEIEWTTIGYPIEDLTLELRYAGENRILSTYHLQGVAAQNSSSVLLVDPLQANQMYSFRLLATDHPSFVTSPFVNKTLTASIPQVDVQFQSGTASLRVNWTASELVPNLFSLNIFRKPDLELVDQIEVFSTSPFIIDNAQQYIDANVDYEFELSSLFLGLANNATFRLSASISGMTIIFDTQQETALFSWSSSGPLNDITLRIRDQNQETIFTENSLDPQDHKISSIFDILTINTEYEFELSFDGYAVSTSQERAIEVIISNVRLEPSSSSSSVQLNLGDSIVLLWDGNENIFGEVSIVLVPVSSSSSSSPEIELGTADSREGRFEWPSVDAPGGEYRFEVISQKFPSVRPQSEDIVEITTNYEMELEISESIRADCRETEINVAEDGILGFESKQWKWTIEVDSVSPKVRNIIDANAQETLLQSAAEQIELKQDILEETWSEKPSSIAAEYSSLFTCGVCYTMTLQASSEYFTRESSDQACVLCVLGGQVINDASFDMLRTEPVELQGSVSMRQCSAADMDAADELVRGGVTYEWHVQPDADENDPNASSVKFTGRVEDGITSTLTPLALYPGITYNARLYAWIPESESESPPEDSSLSSSRINVISQPLVASIRGGSLRTVSVSDSLTLNASDSYDPDQLVPNNQLSFLWSCSPSSLCSDSVSDLLSQSNSSAIVDIGSGILQPDATYIFSVSVFTQDRVSGESQVIIETKQEEIPRLLIEHSYGSIIAPGQELRLRAVFQDSNFGSEFDFRWESESISPEDTLTEITNPNLVVKPHVFPPGTQVTLTALASTSFAQSKASVTFKTSTPPQLEDVTVSPSTGTIYSTQFNIQAVPKDDHPFPIQFEYFLQRSSSPSGNDPSSLQNKPLSGRFLKDSSYTFQSPDIGVLNICVTVRDSKSASSSSCTEINVQEPENDEERSEIKKQAEDNVRNSVAQNDDDAFFQSVQALVNLLDQENNRTSSSSSSLSSSSSASSLSLSSSSSSSINDNNNNNSTSSESEENDDSDTDSRKRSREIALSALNSAVNNWILENKSEQQLSSIPLINQVTSAVQELSSRAIQDALETSKLLTTTNRDNVKSTGIIETCSNIIESILVSDAEGLSSLLYQRLKNSNDIAPSSILATSNTINGVLNVTDNIVSSIEANQVVDQFVSSVSSSNIDASVLHASTGSLRSNVTLSSPSSISLPSSIADLLNQQQSSAFIRAVRFPKFNPFGTQNENDLLLGSPREETSIVSLDSTEGFSLSLADTRGNVLDISGLNETINFELEISNEIQRELEQFNNSNIENGSSSQNENETEYQIQCAFFIPETNQWSSEGCSSIRINDAQIQCACHHLTDFSVGVERIVRPVSPGDGGNPNTASVFSQIRLATYIGTGGAVVFGLFIGILTTVLLHMIRKRNQNNDPHSIEMQNR